MKKSMNQGGAALPANFLLVKCSSFGVWATKMKFQGSGLNASPEILSFRWLLCEYIFFWVGGESVYFRRDMHSKVPSSFMLVVMADGRPNLSSKKLVDSHMHFSAGNWNYRPTNICIETSVWSAKGWCYWKCILNNSPKLNFGHLGLQLEHFTNKKIGGKRLRPDSSIFFYVDLYGACARFLHRGRVSQRNLITI